MRRKSLLVFGVFSALVATLMCRSVYALDNSYTVTYPYYAFVENPDEPWQTVWDALDATGTVEYSD